MSEYVVVKGGRGLCATLRVWRCARTELLPAAEAAGGEPPAPLDDRTAFRGCEVHDERTLLSEMGVFAEAVLG